MVIPGISTIATYFPKVILTNEQLVEKFGFKHDFLSRKLGISFRHIAGKDEAVSDMAAAAATTLFSTGIVGPNDIDLLVICTQNPDYKLPSTANIVQKKLGLKQTVSAFDINQGCSGFVIGLSVVRSMMVAEGIKNALLITAEAYSKVIDKNDRETLPLFGDAAAATLISDGGFARFGRFVWGSDGSGADKLIVRGGGGSYPNHPPTGEYALSMDGRAIFNFMMQKIPVCVRDCLSANSLTMDDIDLFAFHQASQYMLENLADRLGLSADRVPINIQNTGNTVSSTIPVLLESIGFDSLKGKRVLLVGFGVGLSWAATILTFQYDST